jgi:16S rRNA processing protein RimM
MTSRRRRKAARRREKKTGSPISGEPEFVAVGKLRRPHGLHGEILTQVMTDFPDRIKPGVTLLLGEDHQPVEIRSCRVHSKGLLIAFNEYQTREEVGMVRNQNLFVKVSDSPPLPEGEYYHHQLLGLQVMTDEGRELGRVAQILETGANDVYVVRSKDGIEVLLPAIDEVILDVDLEAGLIHVHLLPGLLPDKK